MLTSSRTTRPLPLLGPNDFLSGLGPTFGNDVVVSVLSLFVNVLLRVGGAASAQSARWSRMLNLGCGFIVSCYYLCFCNDSNEVAIERWKDMMLQGRHVQLGV